MKKIKSPVILLCLITSMLSSLASADTVWEYVDKKLEKKKFERWSLSSWFYQKEQMNLQDQWLYMNTDRSGLGTEFYIEYLKTNFDKDTADNLNDETDGTSYEAAFYLGPFGLVGRKEEYANLSDQSEGSLNLRLIGSSHQSTHLILTYGIRNFEVRDEGKFSQSFYGGEMSLYLLPFLGFDGRYRYYIQSENEDESDSLRSARTQWGVFIDLSFVRVFVNQFEENLILKNSVNQSLTKQQVKGTSLGVRLYF